MTRSLGMFMKLAALAVCLIIAFSGSHPPAHAQETARDAVQDQQIGEINRHLENSDRITDLQAAQLQTQAVAIAEMQTESRVFFGLLTFLVGGSIVVQIRVKRA